MQPADAFAIEDRAVGGAAERRRVDREDGLGPVGFQSGAEGVGLVDGVDGFAGAAGAEVRCQNGGVVGVDQNRSGHCRSRLLAVKTPNAPRVPLKLSRTAERR